MLTALRLFNWLAILLCVPLLDDKRWLFSAAKPAAGPDPIPPPCAPPAGPGRDLA